MFIWEVLGVFSDGDIVLSVLRVEIEVSLWVLAIACSYAFELWPYATPLGLYYVSSGHGLSRHTSMGAMSFSLLNKNNLLHGLCKSCR